MQLATGVTVSKYLALEQKNSVITLSLPHQGPRVLLLYANENDETTDDNPPNLYQRASVS